MATIVELDETESAVIHQASKKLKLSFDNVEVLLQKYYFLLFVVISLTSQTLILNLIVEFMNTHRLPILTCQQSQ